MVEMATAFAQGDPGLNGAVRRFLLRYGYLAPVSPEAAPTRRPDDEAEAAIALYQRLHGLPQTGQVDAETLRLMATPRCGVGDLVAGTQLTKGASPADGWGRRNITFAIDLAHDLPPLGPATIESEVTSALDAWGTAGALSFSAAFPADIFVAFRRGDHGDGAPEYSFDGTPGGILAHAFEPRHPGLAGHVHLDADERWSVTLPVTGSADLPTLLLHEIGHALGLGHDLEDRSAVMHERFEIGESRRMLGQSDIRALRAIYV